MLSSYYGEKYQFKNITLLSLNNDDFHIETTHEKSPAGLGFSCSYCHWYVTELINIASTLTTLVLSIALL